MKYKQVTEDANFDMDEFLKQYTPEQIARAQKMVDEHPITKKLKSALSEADKILKDSNENI
jgi:hypothetical protein